MTFKRILCISAVLIFCTSGSAMAASFEDYVRRLNEHPQVEKLLAESAASNAQGAGELGLPDPMFMIGVDNMPISDPAFDRFLPTSKVIGFSQAIPNPALRGAKADKLQQMSKKQALIANYTLSRLRFMLVAKLAEYESVKTQQKLIKTQLGHYHDLENTFKGQIESGRSVYQRFSEVDVERAEAERKQNDLDSQKAAIEAEFIRLVGEVPEIGLPEIVNENWDKNPNVIYAVLIAAEDVAIAQKDIGIADAAFLPNFGVNAVYKQREGGRNGMFSGDDWFSVQAQVSIPLWASANQKPKLQAAKDRQRGAMFAYDDVSRMWVKQMTALQSARDAAAKNVAVLQDKDHAMKGKIDAAQRNYEAGTEDLDRVLLAKIDRLNIQAQLAQVKAAHIAKTAEFNSNIASQNIGGFKETQE
ncbi:MAG: TolC family protein [Pseudomonadota bacterium]|nr:TolC family protein [Pseudomonadota bacterium]QKK04259.1 MAG: TolC family protein [Pseudomonadota bacterium]